MDINLLNLRNLINKAYLKVKPTRLQIETFKKNITNLFDQIKENESEEFHKNIISEFLKNTYYSPNNYINTKGRSDLVIHNGKDSSSTVGVLFEVKKPSNKSEMPTIENIKSKAFQELILYFLRERISNKNIEVKHLIITNIFEWFIFDATDFDKLFAEDKSLIKQFTDFEEGRLSGTNTDFFYKRIAEPFCNNTELSISATYFDIRDFEAIIKNADKEDDHKLISLYKILSPEHLLKLPFANDSNNLDKTFYNELLHIIGLEESKVGSKKIIGRKIEKNRNFGSLIENSITIIKSEDCLTQIDKLSEYGNNKEEQLFNISLELVITWINRILFLKLLEGQLIRYNNGDKLFRFLNVEKIHDYDELNKLFFQALAVKEDDRSEAVKQKFKNIPYLNSSLFEPNSLEHKTIRISNLDDHYKLPVLRNTVLKDNTGRKLAGEIDPLEYLFRFLDSYDFSSEGSENIQEENKTLINASVLGLIFEKINGYKDGSFFTPGFITMYMCHETIRRAVVQKFNDVKGWKCETISDVYNKIEDIKEANCIINSLRICDPAVGSGHFLVSALNEIIAVKSELRILTDKEGKRLKDYTVEVFNDELVITDTNDKLFDYNPKDKESQRIQETLFSEKQTIIENCLFGVDINPNSVKICRLRLWIELLKNAFYKTGTKNVELETLPNIDINIKTGNSLISRYPLDADIKAALKSSKWNVDNYREAVMTYRNAQSKEEKRSMEQLISKIKNDFETVVSRNDKRFLKLNKLSGELLSLTSQSSLFELTKAQKEEWNKKLQKITAEIRKYETELEEIKGNKIYENAFEWRFEFPEVLDNEGNYVGFDIITGNPPYGVIFNKEEKAFFKTNFKTITGKYESYGYFIEFGLNLLKNRGLLSYITPHTWLTIHEASTLRTHFLSNSKVLEIIKLPSKIFEDATVEPIIFICKKNLNSVESDINIISVLVYNDDQKITKISKNEPVTFLHRQNDWKDKRQFNILASSTSLSILEKCRNGNPCFSDLCDFSVGVQAYDTYSGQSSELVKQRPFHSDFQKDETYVKELNGKDVSRYAYNWPKNTWISYGNWLAHPRQSKFFTGERILVREITGIGKYLINACYVEESLVNYKSVLNVILLEKARKAGYRTEFVLGILNSSLMSWIFKMSANKIVTQTFPRVSILDIKQFPFKEIDFKVSREKTLHDKIVNSVNRLHSLKDFSSLPDTNEMNGEIDRLVYELFGLTEEEIRIVEKDCE